MKERPILFTPAMAAAVHAGMKTQTRRLVKPQPDDLREYGGLLPEGHVFCPIGDNDTGLGMRDPLFLRCPYGVPGDRLLVRESVFDVRGWRHAPLFADVTADFLYKGEVAFIGCHRWKPSIHMPRVACRSVLEVVSVRVEQVESIRTEDAIAEGFDNNTHFLNTFYKINKRAPEGSNPWVWVIKFRRLGGADAGGCCPPAPPAEGKKAGGGA